MSSLITAVIGKVCIMKLNTNAGPRTNRNILRRGGTIPDPCMEDDFVSALHGSGRPRLQFHAEPYIERVATWALWNL